MLQDSLLQALAKKAYHSESEIDLAVLADYLEQVDKLPYLRTLILKKDAYFGNRKRLIKEELLTIIDYHKQFN